MSNIIYTDGSSRGNPGPGGWGAVVILGDSVRELGGREASTTNNRMELLAVCAGLEATDGAVTVVTDSAYVANGARAWINGWKKNGWKTKAGGDVSNKDLWERYDEAAAGRRVSWLHIQGHAGVPGNERCDVIATSYADNADVSLYGGKVETYPVRVVGPMGEPYVTTDERKLATKAASKSKGRTGKAYSYLSSVGGVILVHQTWDECKARVDGVKGARFKKALSQDEEQSIKSEWASGSKR